MQFNEILNYLNNYEPGKDIELIAKEYGVKEIIKLASNENPFGVPPKAIESLMQNLNKAYLYPDDSMIELKSKLAQKYKLKNENIIIGAGSDQVIEFALHAKLNNKNAFLQAGVSFAMYEIYAKQFGAKCYKTQSITHDLNEFKKYYNQYQEEIKVVFLCLPNNPLGECLNANEVFEFIKEVDKDCLVIIDAAYNEFASFKDNKKCLKPCDLVEKFENVLFLGTFSKLYGLGGLRIGYGIANIQIINALHKLRAPFNVNHLALKAAIAALDDEEFIKKTLENNFTQMELYEEFAKRNHIKTLKSYTNFITYFFDQKNSTDLSEKLLKKGIIIRNLQSYGLNAMRITIGKPYENERFFVEFEKVLKE
ncbi:histidinol-phosphate transaminase [Campylobacter hepaticus]|uniref:Histidinol-phosphate aminotransferase n=1 Tax=Campylobacter hepaticus TaxID=1813019 RepID=A0A424Z334_9BACT|nr:histidinol-phosphate transaminase [Campylobacter hepaticus]MDX2323157.1 histidinol-phosphate transaminase [Campylobacter hepaticus]MDX2332470.1 histidinol-phosphate transaminase [Campylobacter hepaticus]MDX2409459.1 histidinol-phosphate transaminase [Campylobacter hepaticus]RQD68761.1 histidinol-phosphate transaminase [Campylobacter hepaticus]RQD88716.1 histidinol-phosphate transaminase [Campylobacter hepaticus]